MVRLRTRLPFINPRQTINLHRWSPTARAIVDQLVAESFEQMRLDGVNPKEISQVNARLARVGTSEARSRLVTYNARFALRIAGSFCQTAIVHEDLISAALESTMMAAQTWNPDHPNPVGFPGYITGYITARSLALLRTVRRRRKKSKVYSLDRFADLGWRLDVDIDLRPEDATSFMVDRTYLTSPYPEAEDWVSIQAQRDVVESCVSSLDPRTAAIVRACYGLNVGEEPKSQTQIAQERGVSRQAISATLKQAVKQLAKTRRDYIIRQLAK